MVSYQYIMVQNGSTHPIPRRCSSIGDAGCSLRYGSTEFAVKQRPYRQKQVGKGYLLYVFNI